jgi:hypothetical protein
VYKRPQTFSLEFLKNCISCLSLMVVKSTTVFRQEEQKRPFSSPVISSQFSWQGEEMVSWNFFINSLYTDAAF